MLKTRHLATSMPLLNEYNSLEIPQCFGHIKRVDRSRTVSLQVSFFSFITELVRGEWGGEGDEIFFICLRWKFLPCPPHR